MTYDEIKNTLLMIADPVDRLEMVMDLGTRLTDVPDLAVCTDITGCASTVKICIDGNRYYGWADSALVRGIVAILISMIDGKNIDEVKKMDLLGEFSSLQLNLGAGRVNGINSMVNFLHNL